MHCNLMPRPGARIQGQGGRHAGIVLGRRGEIVETIEGNTNDDGSREGYEVCPGYRGLKGMDFVMI